MVDTTGVAAPSSIPPVTGAAQTPSSGGSLAAAIAALLLLDLGVETLLAGSPIRWPVMGVEVVALVLVALLWKATGPTIRLAIPLAAIAGSIAWALLRLGSGADPALRMATLGLPRLGVVLVLVALLASVVLPFGFRVLRRAWYLALVFALVAVSACVPLVRGLLAGTPLSRVVAGTLDWPSLPSWLQGGVVSTQVVLPLGLIAALALVARSIVKRRQATWVVAATIIVAAALVAQSAEMLRAGRSTLLAPVTAPLLARVSVGPAEEGPPIPGGTVAPAAAGTTVSGGPAPVSAGAVTPAPAGAVTTATAGQPAANKAIELRVTGHRTAATVGSQAAEQGREFVIVDTAWKNILPQQKVNRKKASDRTAGAGSLGFGGGRTAQDEADDDANTTIESVKFEVGPLSKHLWLVADGRFAEPVDVNATGALDGHLGPERISIANFQQVVSGPIAFKAPAGAQALSILFLDAVHGHILVPLKGAPPVLASSLGGGSRANEFVDLALTGASWSNAAAGQNGTRAFVVGLRGISRQEALVDVPFGEYAFLQTDQGCLAEPDAKVGGLTRPLAPMGRFLPFVPSEGQLAFSMPPDANPIALLVRLQQGGPIDIPLKAGAAPRWPTPAASVTDGDVLRVHRLPGLAVPTGVPPGPSGSERVALDLVVQNLRSGSGIELQQDQQFRLVAADGKRYQPSADSAQAPCRLTGSAVVPAGSSRRFTLVYDVPQGQPLQFEYRGFNVKSDLSTVR